MTFIEMMGIDTNTITFVAILVLALLVVLCFILCSINGRHMRDLEADTDAVPSIDEMRKYLKKMKEISDEVKTDISQIKDMELRKEVNAPVEEEAEEPAVDMSDKTMPTPPPINRIVNNITQVDADALTKVAVVRYNAFPGVTGSISFSVALLNAKNSGIILTSLYGHESSNCYIREIENGECTTQLLEEEQEALENAMAKGTVKEG